MRLNNIIIKPIVTEKSVDLTKDGKYTFRVHLKAHKGLIASELSKMYGVDVVDVNTSIVPGKKKRILKTRRFTKTSKWKKAIIKLKEGQKLDIIPKEK